MVFETVDLLKYVSCYFKQFIVICFKKSRYNVFLQKLN